ncbi:MAG: zinc-ribbon domain-containing protein [Actinomycetota bacterium]
MNCPNCGVENRPGAKFCKQCGSSLALVCPNGHPIEANAEFCDECGASVGSVQPRTAAHVAPPVPQPPASERRLVSVLFADLVGFTDTVGEPRCRRGARAALEVLRHLPSPDPALRRNG